MKAIKKLPEARQQNGFKRSDLMLGGTSGRRVQEALKSLTSTGYLDSDGRRGPQGSSYTLAREPDKAALGVHLRPPDENGTAEEDLDTDNGDKEQGEVGEEEAKRGLRGIARDDDRAIKSPNLQVKGTNARSRGGDGKGDLGEEDEEEGRDGEEDEGEPGIDPLEKLTERGWFRSRDVGLGGGGEPSVDHAALYQDPLVRWIRGWVCLYDPAPGSLPWIGTTEELFEAEGEEGSRPEGWPSTPREVYERLVRMAPALQAKYRYGDVRLQDGPPIKGGVDPETLRREGYLRVEYWRKEGAAEEEGIWVLTALKPGWRVPEDENERRVWHKVANFEGLTPEGLTREDEGFDFGD